MKNFCIIGASGKLGQYMFHHTLDRGCSVVGVCRERSANIARRVDYTLFMVAALVNDELIHEAPAIVSCQTPSALTHGTAKENSR